MDANPLRSLPSVDSLLNNEALRPLSRRSRPLVTDLVRRVIDSARDEVARGGMPPTEEDLAREVLQSAGFVLKPSLRPVINATGVIIQTNLGRAPLSHAAVRAMDAVNRGYSNLEFDIDAGTRGSRSRHLEALIRHVTGAESAMVVNNNAAALLLVLSALASGREVVISRGQAIEIGGGFRIPDVMRQSGATLVEVGTTNRTYGRDYQAAIGERTAAIVRVHTSNYRVVGFTAQPALDDLARIAHERDIMLIDDIGSGCLLETEAFGLAHEPTVGESIRAGADLCLFSGDKLLGGPQAGVIVGRARIIEDLSRHPLVRALRPGKSTLAALHATLLHYAQGEALEQIPVWRMISASLDSIAERANTWVTAIGPQASVIDGESMVGGGSLPGESLPTRLLAIQGEGAWITELARNLRLGNPPVVARVESGQVLLDLRTVAQEDDKALCAAVRAGLAQAGG